MLCALPRNLSTFFRSSAKTEKLKKNIPFKQSTNEKNHKFSILLFTFWFFSPSSRSLLVAGSSVLSMMVGIYTLFFCWNLPVFLLAAPSSSPPRAHRISVPFANGKDFLRLLPPPIPANSFSLVCFLPLSTFSYFFVKTIFGNRTLQFS